MIKIKNLTFNYKNEKNRIFEDTNMDINGGIWLLKGENGSGKSTLFEILMNSHADIGDFSENTSINIEGEKIFLDNSISLPLNLKELDIAKYIFHINNVTLDKEYAPIYNDRKLISYSSGERKLATLRILSNLKIDILLIDEYITNLDENNVIEVMEILRNMSSKGALIIVSSNEIDIINRFENKIIIKNKKIEVREGE